MKSYKVYLNLIIKLLAAVLIFTSVVSVAACADVDTISHYDDDDDDSDDSDDSDDKSNDNNNEGSKDTDDSNESLWSALFGDDNDDKKVNSRDKLEKQYECIRYYFRIGYTDLWKVNLAGNDDFVEGYSEQGLALQLVPFKRTESTDKDGNKVYDPSTTVDEGVQFNIFCNWEKDAIPPVASENTMVGYVMDMEHDLFFNNINYIGNIRQNYVQDENGEDVTYNKIWWKKVGFTFTGDDGESWKGVWCMATKGTNYYIVSYEAHAAKFDTYFADFELMMEDFKKLGWESNDSVS